MHSAFVLSDYNVHHNHHQWNKRQRKFNFLMPCNYEELY